MSFRLNLENAFVESIKKKRNSRRFAEGVEWRTDRVMQAADETQRSGHRPVFI